MKLLLISLIMSAFVIGVTSAEDPPDSLANVMFIHASPDAPAVNIEHNDKALEKPIDYCQTTGYQKIEPGLQEIDFHVADHDNTLVPAQVRLEADISYSIFMVDSAKKADLLVIQDHVSTPPAGKTLIRFVNLSPDAPELDLTHDRRKVAVADRGFKEYSDFKTIDAGKHEFQLRVAGTDSVLVKYPEVLLLSGKAYTFVARGFVAGDGNRALKVEMIENR